MSRSAVLSTRGGKSSRLALCTPLASGSAAEAIAITMNAMKPQFDAHAGRT